MDLKRSFRNLGLVGILVGTQQCLCVDVDHKNLPRREIVSPAPFQDVDGDGKLDFVYCETNPQDGYGLISGYALYVKYNNGDGTFREPPQLLAENAQGFPGYCP